MLCGCRVTNYVAVTSLAISHRLLLSVWANMTKRRCSALRIIKFEFRFITTVNVVCNLASLAGLLTYLHSFTHVLAHARRLTLTLINNRTFTHSRTHAHLHTHNRHIDTQTYTYAQHMHSLKNTDIQYTHTHAYINTRLYYTVQSHAHIYTYNTQILTHIHTFKHAHIHAYNYTPTHMRAYFLVFKNT